MPYYAASNKSMKAGINKGDIEYIDQHLSHFGQQVDYGFFGNVDVAIIEATAITAEGNIILGPWRWQQPYLCQTCQKNHRRGQYLNPIESGRYARYLHPGQAA